MLQTDLVSLPCALAKRHIPCELGSKLERDKYGYIAHKFVGCKAHGRSRQQVKKDHHLYWTMYHCYCGYDLKCQWTGNKGSDKDYSFTVFEKTYCTPGAHYKENPYCSYGGSSKQCGWHGLTYRHCGLCLEPLEGEPLGKVNGEWKFGPLNLAKRIWRSLTT